MVIQQKLHLLQNYDRLKIISKKKRAILRGGSFPFIVKRGKEE